MVTFAFLGNTLFLTILVSMLSNTFSTIASNATAEIQFRKAVLTLEGVKSDAVFAYQPPFNIVAVFLFLPLKFVVSPRWFHKIHVATVRFINLPLLLIIAVAERRLLWSVVADGMEGAHGRHQPREKQWFWERWRITAHRDIRAVFDLPPPDSVEDEIAVDDDMTRHMIRRQFVRHNTNDSLKKPLARHNTGDSFKKPPSRRDSMYPGLTQKVISSLEGGDRQDVRARLEALEATTNRIEVLLARLAGDMKADEDENLVPMGESSALGQMDAAQDEALG